MEQVLEFFQRLFQTESWPPRWHCGRWTEFHGWLYICSDLAIWLAYFAIPVFLVKFVTRKRDVPLPNVFWLFGAFILLCGLTHLVDAMMFWWPAYRLNGLIRFTTAVVSWLTVAALIKVLPEAFALRSTKELEVEIFERKKVEEALKKSNEQFFKVFDNNPIGMIITEMETKRIQYVNKIFVTNFGYGQEEVVGKTSDELDLIESESRARILAHLDEQGGVKDIEILVKKKDGETFWALTSVQEIIINDKKFSLTSFHNISKRKKMQDELRASEEKFRGLLESAPDAIVIAGNNGKVLMVNAQTENLFGFTRGEIVGLPIELLIPGRFHKNHTEHRTHYFSDPRARSMGAGLELFGKKKNGQEFAVEISLSPLKTKDGIIVSAAIRDITARKTVEKKLEKYTLELERQNKEIEQFAYLASHDLQEPLRTVANYVGLLQKQFKDNLVGDSGEYMDYITGGTRRMQLLVNDLLQYSRIGREKNIENIDCNKILDEVLIDLSASIDESKTRIESAWLPVINGHSSETKSLFQNLISNAIKFRKKDIPAIINVTAESRDKEWLFGVKDNGIGIEGKYREKLFKIFQRLHSQTEYAGTGIGLAQCKKIVELQGGKIWVESEIGKGSTFYFTIPKII